MFTYTMSFKPRILHVGSQHKLKTSARPEKMPCFKDSLQDSRSCEFFGILDPTLVFLSVTSTSFPAEYSGVKRESSIEKLLKRSPGRLFSVHVV